MSPQCPDKPCTQGGRRTEPAHNDTVTHTQQHQCDRSIGSYAQSRRAAVAGGLRFALCPLLLLKKLSIAAFSGPGPEVPWWRTPRPFALASVGEIGPKPGGISPARFLHTLINHILRHVMSDRNLNAIAFVVLVLTPFGDASCLYLVACSVLYALETLAYRIHFHTAGHTYAMACSPDITADVRLLDRTIAGQHDALACENQDAMRLLLCPKPPNHDDGQWCTDQLITLHQLSWGRCALVAGGGERAPRYQS